ncbi:MAG TPA: MMPL family transporter, partial [Desulfuromonadaceae bacterium]
MPHRLYTRRFLAWWVGHVERRYLATVVLFALATLGILAYSAVNFKIDADLTNMVSEKLPFRNLEKQLYREFPQLTDVIVVVVDGDSVGEAMDARKLIADRLRKETRFFKSVQEPGGSELFERNGLLYLDPPELEALSDNLAKGEPLMGLLFKDYSLRGFFSLVGTALDNYGNESAGEMDIMFDQMAAALTNTTQNRTYHLPWESMMYGEKEAAEQRSQFIIIKPYLDKDGMIMGNPPPVLVRNLISPLKLGNTVRVRLTGDVLLSYDNVTTVEESVGFATFASLLLVGLVIIVGLGSGRLVLASLLTLLAGLVWTTGFALMAIGSLNLISITFAVLFVGLGIDYGIQFCLRYRELVETDHDNRESLVTTATGVGTGLFLSCITTSIGFFAFLPTAYSGVAQLGLISGVGMFIGLFCNLTLLPALLTLFRFRKGMTMPFLQKMPITDFPYRHYKVISVAALVLGLCCAATLPKVYFDYNPLNLYNQSSETITTLKELFKNKQAPPWTISILTKDRQAAEELKGKLGQLKEVKAAITVSDFVPDKMEEKMDILSFIALFMPDPQQIKVNKLTYQEKVAALDGLEAKLAKFLEKDHGSSGAKVQKLLDAVREFKKYAQAPGNGEKAFAGLQENLLYGLPSLLNRLDKMLHPTTFTEKDLPAGLVRDYVSPNGYYRVQVFPREDILKIDALGRFVNAVKTVTPNG